MTDKLGSEQSVGELMWYGVGYSAFLTLNATESTFMFSFIDIHGIVHNNILFKKIS